MYLRCIVSTVSEHIIKINQKIYAGDAHKLCLFNSYIHISASIHLEGMLISLWQPFYLSLYLHLSVKVLFFLYFYLHTEHLFLDVSVSIFTKLLHPKYLKITYLYNLSTFLSICLSNYLSVRICIFIAGYPEA